MTGVAGRSPRAFIVATVTASLVLALASCTAKTGSSAAPTPDLSGPGNGSYFYDGDFGVAATLEPDGSGWQLTVKNTTGDTLGKPGIYALAATDGSRIDATLTDPSPIGDGEESSFSVSFERKLAPQNMGLVVLMFGGENFGPLAPPDPDG